MMARRSWLLATLFTMPFIIIFTSMNKVLQNEDILPLRDERLLIDRDGEFIDKQNDQAMTTSTSMADEQSGHESKQENHDKNDISTDRPMKAIITSSPISKRPSCFDDPGTDTTCRYDDVGKYLDQTAKFTIIHKPSDAIPAERRIPKDQGGNHTYIAQRRSEGPKDGSLTPIVEYNPTIVPLTNDMDPKLLAYLTGRYHDDISDEEADKVKYLSVARGSNFHNCGASMMRRMNNPTKEYALLSLSLLDDNLQPIPGASASVNVAGAILPSGCYNKAMMEYFQDYHIYAARTTKGNVKKDQLFLIASDVKSYIFPLDIRRVPAPTNDASGWNTKVKGNPVKMIAENENDKLKFYGRGLQVRFMDQLASIKKQFCAKVMKSNILDFQKNYHFFETEINGKIRTHMETRPHGLRKTRKVNFYSERFHEHKDWELVPNGTINQHSHRGGEDIEWGGHSPPDQWKYPLEDKTQWKGGGLMRGTACCIDLGWGDNETVKVGISHSVSSSRSYVSRFYAFDPTAERTPVKAVSGPFCLGGSAENDVNADSQIFTSAEESKLFVANETYDCPRITFPSGIAEYQANPGYAIISYGVNDCFSRSMVVPKTVIKELLNLKNGATASNDFPATQVAAK
jgi:hypothetical protein